MSNHNKIRPVDKDKLNGEYIWDSGKTFKGVWIKGKSVK